MSVINEYKDPMSGKVNHFAKGSIKFISIKPVKNADPDGVKRTPIPARNGQPAKMIESTHTISFLMQEVDDNTTLLILKARVSGLVWARRSFMQVTPTKCRLSWTQATKTFCRVWLHPSL
ncbi:terminase large subunit [Salmonella phage 40]|nr:terminase large subunit [Salmonella phage 40]